MSPPVPAEDAYNPALVSRMDAEVEQSPASVSPRARQPRSRFFAVLALIALAAMGLRFTYVMTITRHDHGFYDAIYYELQATRVADGLGYTDPLRAINQYTKNLPPGPAADHPPLTVFVLVPVAWIFRSGFVMRLEMVLLGTATVVLLGLLGRRLGGDAVGLVAAGIAAVYPELWVNDGLIMSETVCALLVVLTILAVYRFLDRPRWPRAALVGIACGFAALARAELLLLAPLLAVWLLFTRRLDSNRTRAVSASVVIVGMVVAMAPWFVYNQTRFHDTVIVSTNDGVAMLGSNCDKVYGGPGIGLTDLIDCVPGKLPPGDQSQISRVFLKKALRYIGDHKQRFPVVVSARIGRDFSLFRPQDMVKFNSGEGRKKWITVAGLVFYYPLFLLAGAGVVLLRRRRQVVWPLVAPVFVVIGSAFASYGQTRFRISAEPSILLLSSVALVALARRASARSEEPRSALPADQRTPRPAGRDRPSG